MSTRPPSDFPEHWQQRLGATVEIADLLPVVTVKVEYADTRTYQITVRTADGKAYYVYGPSLKEIAA